MALERRPASPGPLSLVLAATVTRDNLEAMKPPREEGEADHAMSDEDRPLLHTELLLDGCIKLDGKPGHLKSLNIFVEDDDDVSQSRPGSPQRTISVTMCDKESRRSCGEGMRSDLRNDDGREVGPGRQKLLRQKSNVVMDKLFNIHNYQIRLSGKQPQGLAAALTDARPEILPALKEPKGLKAVLYLGNLSDQETVGGKGRILGFRADEDGRGDTSSTSMGRGGLPDQEQTSPFQQHGGSEVLDVCSYEYDSGDKSYPDDNYSYGKDRNHVHSKDIASPRNQVSENTDDNLRILETLPTDLVSSLVGTQSKIFTASECEESEREEEPYRQAYSKKTARNSQEDFPMDEILGSSRTDPRRNFTRQDKSSKSEGRIRRPGPSCKESKLSEKSLRTFHDHVEELEGADEGPKSPRGSKHLSRNMGVGTSSSCSTSAARAHDSNHNGRSRSRSRKKNPKRVLEGTSEEQEVHHECILPPSHSEKGKDLQHRPRKMTKGHESLRFAPLDLSVDGDRSRRSTHNANSYTDSHQERGSRDRMDMLNSKAKETGEKMLSISKLLENMSSVTQQMLNNSPQPWSRESHTNQAWNQQTSRDFQVVAGSISRQPQQIQTTDTNCHFARNMHPSQLLNEGASQANETPFDSSHQAHFLDGRPPEQPSTADNLQSQIIISASRMIYDSVADIRSLVIQVHASLRGAADFEKQFDVVDNRLSPQLINQATHRSSKQLADGGPSQMSMPDSHFQQLSPMRDHQSRLLGSPLSHPGLQRDGSILLGTMNKRYSRMHHGEDSFQHPEGMSRKVQKPSGPYGMGDSRPSLNTRPSQVGSQDKDMELFDTMSNRASQLAVAQQQSLNLSKLKVPQKYKGNENSQQTLPRNGRQSQIQTDRSAQLNLEGTHMQQPDPLSNRSSRVNVQAVDSRMFGSPSIRQPQLGEGHWSQLNNQREVVSQVNNQGSQHFQVLENRTLGSMNMRQSQSPSRLGTLDTRAFDSLDASRPLQLDPQGTELLVAAMNARRSQGRVNIGPSQKYMQGSKSQKVDNRNKRSSQNVNMRVSQGNPQDGNLPQFKDMKVPVRPVQLLNTRISQMNLTKTDPQGSDGRASQLQMMNMQPSELLDSRLSHSNMRADHQIASANLNLQARTSQHFADMKRRPSQLPSQMISQMNMPENNLRESDERPSQLWNNRPSQTMSIGSPQLLNARPTYSNILDDQQMNLPGNGLQEFDGQSAQLLNTRSSPMMNARSSQLLNGRSSLSNMLGGQQIDTLDSNPQYVSLQQFEDINIPRSSQVLNTRISHMNLPESGPRKLDGRLSQGFSNRPSQMMDMRSSQLFDSRTPTSNIMPNDQQVDILDPLASQLVNTGSSQFHMQNNDVQHFDSMEHRNSGFLEALPSQGGIQEDHFQQYDSSMEQPSQLLDHGSGRPSQAEMFYDGLQDQYDQENSRPSLFESSRPSQMSNTQQSQVHDQQISQADMELSDELQQYGPSTIEFQISLTGPPQATHIQEGGEFQQYNPSSTRQTQLWNGRQSEVVIRDDGSQQYNPRQSQLANTRLSESYRQGDNQQLYDGTNPTSNSFMNTIPSQTDMRPSQILYERPSQIALQGDTSEQFDVMDPRHSQLINTRSSQSGVPYDDTEQFDPMNSRDSQLLDLRASQMPMQSDDFQQFDPMNPRQSQVLNARLSQIGMQDENFKQFKSVSPRQSQGFNARSSQVEYEMQDENSQQFDPMDRRQSHVLNPRQSLQVDMQDGNFQQFEPISPRKSQAFNARPSQVDYEMQDENFQQSDYMNNQPSQLLSIRPSQVEFQDANTQDFDPSRQSQYFDPEPSQRASTSQPEANLEPKNCENCLEYDHEAVNCPTQECLNCREPGHYARFCIEANAAADPNAEYEIDPTMHQEEDMPQEYDTGDYNIDSENTAQMQRNRNLAMMVLQQSTDNKPWYPDAKFQQPAYQPVPYDMIKQFGFLQVENLRRSLAQTVSNMLQEVKELEARSQQSSVTQLEKPRTSQSEGISRNPRLAKADKPHQSCSSGGGGVRMAYESEDRTFQINQEKLRHEGTSPQLGTGRSSKLVEDHSWEEDLRKSRISQWLINLPTQYESVGANKYFHSQDELEQYAQASELYISP
ncbi:hypothetical protein R1sor_000787 [Riccia sorocarpa]|uniref:CCHC-type domain-containing protein n=1 Tax=Riccia sorocarpa TaxID=122646 RepID=A0ABD3GXC5_9MARC